MAASFRPKSGVDGHRAVDLSQLSRRVLAGQPAAQFRRDPKTKAAKWNSELLAGADPKFVKLALTKPGIFNLNQAVSYGLPLEATAAEATK